MTTNLSSSTKKKAKTFSSQPAKVVGADVSKDSEAGGEDFQTFLKRQEAENSKMACESKLIMRKGTPWYSILSGLETSASEKGKKSETAASTGPVSVQVVEKLRKEGASVMEGEMAQFKREQNLSKADAEWFKTVLKSGTFSDRCSALTLAFQASPAHSLEHLKGLVDMAKSKSRHEALLALDAIKDLFSSSENKIFPADRKLRYVHQQPIESVTSQGNADLKRRAALLWYWEETLKTSYLEIIRIVEIIAQDPISHSRERACRLLFDLLNANPHEQDSNILALLANKLGDSERILSSRIPYYFTELVNAHPRVLTAGAIEQARIIIDRPGVTDRTRYYALCFLIQIRLQRSTPTITASLLQIYLGLFTKYILNNLEASQSRSKKDAKRRMQKRIRHKQKKRGEVVESLPVPEEHARLAKALLTGINRAFPFASGAGSELKGLLLGFAEPLLKLCAPCVAFPTTLQAVNLLLTLAPFDEALKKSVLVTLQGILDEQDRLRQASASHALFIRALTRACAILMEINDKASLQCLLKSLMRFCLAIVSPAFVIASLGVVNSVLQRFPAMRSMLNSAPESVEDAKKNGLYELIALTKHYQPRVSRYATELLQNARISLDSASDREIIADPFEKLAFSMLLDVWNRMRRPEGSELVKKSKSGDKNNKKKRKADDSDEEEESKPMDIKKSDNSTVAASLYKMDEYRFIEEFAAEKDARAAKSQASLDKLMKKRRKTESDGEDEEEEDSEDVDEAELEAEADAIMNDAIKKQSKSAFGDENDDDDFAYDLDSDEEDSDEESDEDNSDLDALLVDSDAEDEDMDSEAEAEEELESDFAIEEDLEDLEEETEEVEVEVEEPVVKPSNSKKDKKKKFKGVFASASDYEDALQD